MKKLMTILMCLNLILAPVAMGQTASSQFQENPEAKASASYTNQILSISQAAVGTTALTSCKFGSMLWSLKLYMAGSIAYIASEMMGAKQMKDNLNKKTEDIKLVEAKMKNSTGGGEVQKEALEQALKDQQDTVKFIKQRKMWLMAISAIYAAATAFAVIEVMKSVVPPTGGIPPHQIGVCEPSGVVKAFSIGKIMAAAYTFGVQSSASGSIGKYGSMAAGFAAAIPSVGAKILAALNTAPGRVGIFGATTALVALNLMSLGSKQSTFEENIKKLQAAIKDYEANSANSNSIATDASSTSSGADSGTAGVDSASLSGTSASGTASAINGLASGVSSSSSPVQCLTQTANGTDYSASGCSNPLQVSTAGIDASLNLPTLSSAASSAEKMANALNTGNSAAAELEAANLASMAGRLSQIKDNLVKQANEKAKAAGTDAIDINAEADKQLASMNGAANSALGTSNPALSSSGLHSNGTVSVSADDQKNKNADINSIQSASSNKAIAPATAKTDLGLGISEGGIDSANGANANAVKQASLSESLNSYEMNEGDISSGDNGVSLFKQVSNRYILNYPKIFPKKQLTPVEGAGPTNTPK
jgi:hypothetical protein